MPKKNLHDKKKLDVKSDKRKNDNILNSNNSDSNTLESQHFNELSCRSTQEYCKEVISYFNNWGNIEPQ